ncbi:MAG TPA: hypothetical protein VF592_03725 [Sphingomonas sp.]|uniref:hypothetical protein n=1 Tax=Sphingomonas sp. TaxID=28214 RepID=UPI002ED9C879
MTLNPSTGAWSIAAQDFEMRQALSWTRTATDAAGNATSQLVSIQILNLNDTNPAAFAFGDLLDVTTGSVQTSNTITVAGLGASDSAVAAVSGAMSSELSRNGGVWSAGPVSVVNGDTIAVRHIAAGANSAATATTLAIGATTDTFVTTTVGAAGSALIPVGGTFAWVGDGLSAIDAGVGPGATNAPHQFQALMAGLVQPTALPVLAQSGTTIKTDDGSNRAWIMPVAINAAAAQTPDLFIMGSMGANDNVLATAPGVNPASGQTTNPRLQDWYDAVAYAYAKFQAYGGKRFRVVATIASTKAGETVVDSGETQDRRTRVWAAQAAFVAALGGGDSKVAFVGLTGMLPPSAYSSNTASSFVHIDQRGAYYIAAALKASLDGHIEAKTPAEIMDLIVAGTYPLQGAQLDTDAALTGTAGTVTGPGVTGTIATSKLIANTTGATGITVSQVGTAGGRTKTVVDFAAATPTTANGRLLLQDRLNMTIAATPGAYVMTGALMRASPGFWNFGSDFLGNNFGKWGGGAASLAAPASPGASTGTPAQEAAASPMDTLVLTNPLPVYGSSTTFAGKRGFALYWPSGSTLAGSFEIERPFAHLVNERTRHAPAYLGDVMTIGGNRVATGAGSVAGVSAPLMRLSGTVSQAAGGTVRLEPGLWTPRGLTEADFVGRHIYAGGVAGQAGTGTGALIATLSGSTWTHMVAAGAVATGTVLYPEADVDNGIGGTVTVRSLIGLIVT